MHSILTLLWLVCGIIFCWRLLEYRLSIHGEVAIRYTLSIACCTKRLCTLALGCTSSSFQVDTEFHLCTLFVIIKTDMKYIFLFFWAVYSLPQEICPLFFFLSRKISWKKKKYRTHQQHIVGRLIAAVSILCHINTQAFLYLCFTMLCVSDLKPIWRTCSCVCERL